MSTPAHYRPAGAAPGTDTHTARCDVDPTLAAHVAGYFVVEIAADDEPRTVRALPDGCTDLMFELGEPPCAWLGGPRLEASVYEQRGPKRFFGVQLRPGAGHALLRVPMRELVGAWEPLERFLGDEVTEVARALEPLPTIRARGAVMDAFLARRLVDRPVDQRVASAVDRLVASRGAASVAELARAVGASPRNLDRLFDTWVGVSPKCLARVMRFQGVVERMAQGHAPDWAALAIELGYADQSHLVRDFAAFAGLAPSALLRAGRSKKSDTGHRILSALSIVVLREGPRPEEAMTQAEKIESTFRLSYSVSVAIAAPPSAIWARLTDAKAFPTWNSTVSSIDGEIAKGQKLAIKVPVAPGRTFSPRVVELDAEKRMVWADGMAPMFRGERTFTLEPGANGTTTFSMVEVFAGVMLPVIKGSLPDFRPVFDQYAADLKRASEKV